jgi:hypothetical protein
MNVRRSVVLANIPGLEDAREAWDAAEQEQAFWRDHYTELLQQYPDHFVAVRGGAVVATNPDLQLLLKSLKHQGIEPTAVWVRFLATDPRRLMP